MQDVHDVQDVVSAARRRKRYARDPRQWAGRRRRGFLMGAPELLGHLRYVGLIHTLTPAGGQHVAPRTALSKDRRAVIWAERDALVPAMQAEAEPLPPSRHSGNPLMTAKLAG